MRARDLGIEIGRHSTGPLNAITDVPGVNVGYATVGGVTAEGERSTVNTGVTVILPHDDVWTEPVFAGAHRLNGSGEMTGLEWVREAGELTSPIALTNTHSLGLVRDALVKEQVNRRGPGPYWCLPVVAETYDGVLNDINGHHVTERHVAEALRTASADLPAEGNVGGGTGMICHQFKGGSGTSSRVIDTAEGRYTVGVFVQANHGRRERLSINGVPVGRRISAEVIPTPEVPRGFEPGSGSIVVVVATDAPFLPHQCSRLAQRAALGVGRMGGAGEQYSGDLMLAFSTGNRGIPPYLWDERTDVEPATIGLSMIAPQLMTSFFDLVIDATEEAILNCLVSATTLTGPTGTTAHAIDHELLMTAMNA
ncbi:P1 family peptidase [Brevibacterium sp.]|uniref:DmpA family aminopeptidase n=1 Tax=Brevibacterium sp. TaxID=1701 RepID=UPI002810D0C1|nr:P1 family peptidase [Brevibacterium sp.]